jgi:uncharacterized protein (TIRG00374 family)
MKKTGIHFNDHITPRKLVRGFSGHMLGYLGLTALFFLLSFLTLYFVHHNLSGGGLHFEPALLSLKAVIPVVILLGLYYVFDGMRLYYVIRAMGYTIRFRHIMKLVFVNVFVSNITPLATGGGVVQVYFLHREGIPVGESTAATTIRTILASSILFALTPVIMFAEPNLFGFFNRGKLIVYVAIFCALYLSIFLTILFRINFVRAGLYRFMRFLSRAGILSRRRFRKWFLKLSKELLRFTDGFRRFIHGNPVHVALSFLCTIFFLLSLFSFSVLLMRVMGYNVPILTILAFQVVVTFFMYFAPTPGAAGVAEGGYGVLFANLVMKKDLTLLTFLWRFLTIYIGVLIGLVVIYRELFVRGRRGVE